MRPTSLLRRSVLETTPFYRGQLFVRSFPVHAYIVLRNKGYILLLRHYQVGKVT